jgi:hypothetical protein
VAGIVMKSEYKESKIRDGLIKTSLEEVLLWWI